MTAVWHREPWGSDAERELGQLIAGQRARILGEIQDGRAQLFSVDGDGYRGWIALRFEDEAAGMVCRVIAVRGVNSRDWLEDLRRIVQKAGAVGIIIHAESAAHVRLYARLGFEVEAAEMRLQDGL